jgi:hypothetical protein
MEEYAARIRAERALGQQAAAPAGVDDDIDPVELLRIKRQCEPEPEPELGQCRVAGDSAPLDVESTISNDEPDDGLQPIAPSSLLDNPEEILKPNEAIEQLEVKLGRETTLALLAASVGTCIIIAVSAVISQAGLPDDPPQERIAYCGFEDEQVVPSPYCEAAYTCARSTRELTQHADRTEAVVASGSDGDTIGFRSFYANTVDISNAGTHRPSLCPAAPALAVDGRRLQLQGRRVCDDTCISARDGVCDERMQENDCHRVVGHTCGCNIGTDFSDCVAVRASSMHEVTRNRCADTPGQRPTSPPPPPSPSPGHGSTADCDGLKTELRAACTLHPMQTPIHRDSTNLGVVDSSVPNHFAFGSDQGRSTANGKSFMIGGDAFVGFTYIRFNEVELTMNVEGTVQVQVYVDGPGQWAADSAVRGWVEMDGAGGPQLPLLPGCAAGRNGTHMMQQGAWQTLTARVSGYKSVAVVVGVETRSCAYSHMGCRWERLFVVRSARPSRSDADGP